MSLATDVLQDEIVAEFADFDDWQDKYEYMIELGDELAPLDPRYRNEQHRILGCQSNVWLHADYDPISDTMHYVADSESLIVKGLISLLIRVLNDQSPATVVATQLHFLNQIGLDRHLSSTRSNGLSAMIQEMKHQASLSLATTLSQE